MVERAGGGPRAGRRREPVLVVFQEYSPSVGVASDEPQHGLPGFVHECLVQQRSRKQVERLACLPEPAFGKTAFVHGVAADQVFAQGSGGPDAELRAAQRFDAVSDGNDHVEVVVIHLARDRAAALGSNLCKFCTGSPRVQLSFPKSIADVPGHDRAVPTEQLRHLLLGEPYRLADAAHIHAHLAVRGFVDDDLAAGGGGWIFTVRHVDFHEPIRIVFAYCD